jgi:hypothetical protein
VLLRVSQQGARIVNIDLPMSLRLQQERPMTSYSTNTPFNNLRPQPLWRSVLRSAMAVIDGEVVTRRKVTLQQVDTSAGPASFDLIAPDLISAREIYVVDFRDGFLMAQVNAVATWASSVTRIADIDAVIATIMDKAANDVLVVVNVDTLADIDDAVDRLLVLKTVCPDVPVVIGSTTFAKNNFTQQRRAITDASVRLPCSASVLALAIDASVRNNLH